MIEQTREIVRKFNSIYDGKLVEPKILLPDNEACLRLPGTDGKAKMSKSLGNCIYLSDSKEEVNAKVMKMFTDPNHLKITDPGNVENNTVFTYLDAFCSDEMFTKYLPEYPNLDALKDHYRKGGLGDVKVKRFLANVLNDCLEPIRTKRKELEQNIPYIYEVLKEGTTYARSVAQETLKEVKESMKINYFEDETFLPTMVEKYKNK